MISRRMQKMVAANSVIRAMFEEGLKLAREYGKENVYDFSLGNPNVPAPEALKQAALKILSEDDPVKVHGYMPNAGFPEVREKIALSLNKRFGTEFTSSNILMTVGAAGGVVTVVLTVELLLPPAVAIATMVYVVPGERLLTVTALPAVQAVAGVVIALSVVLGVVWRRFKKGANKVLGRDENAGKEIEDDVAEK